MENNNVIYVSDNESSNDIAPASNAVEVSTPTLTVVLCADCRKIYPNLDALRKDHRDIPVKRIIRTILSCSLTRNTCVHVPSSSSPAPPRGSGAPAPRPLPAGGSEECFVPYVRTAELITPLPDNVGDLRSGWTQDLLSRLNLNPSGSVPRPNSAQPNNVDLDLKLWF